MAPSPHPTVLLGACTDAVVGNDVWSEEIRVGWSGATVVCVLSCLVCRERSKYLFTLISRHVGMHIP